ncbi:unnamed protein product [Triticum aestivum]|nr:hypothetical protein CFC21_032714 [Triticum aestivum]SPT20847.1 unnamed protein product [Triticum aestivum]
MGDEVDAFSEELRRRPEVRIINKYAVLAAYVRITLKSIGALLLLWATVVLLGGFVSSMKKGDFWSVTIIAFVQAAGVFEAIGFAGMDLYLDWLVYNGPDIKYWLQKCRCELNQLPMRQWSKKQIQNVVSFLIFITLSVRSDLVAVLAVSAPLVSMKLSSRAIRQDHGIADGEAFKANMKRALNLFYGAAFAHGAISALWMTAQAGANTWIEVIVSDQHGFSPKVIRAYLRKTKDMCLKNKTSATSWNLITYGAGLLDSSLPEEYAAGGRVLTMLIDKDVPLQVRRLLIRSPRQRIQKLIGTLAWRSPADQEMIWLAARIVEHLASDLNLAHFPGALECISSLLNHKILHLPFVPGQREDGEGIDKDLLLPGLRILENLAHDTTNCTLIYNSKGLLSKIVAPVSSNEFVEDIKSSAAWNKVADGSLKVVSRLMGSSGRTGKNMCRLIANNRNAVKNLEVVLEMDIKSNSGIIELQMRAIEVLTQLALHHPASASFMMRREKLIERALHIFLAADWMEDYLKDEKKKIEKPTLSQKNTSPIPSMGRCIDNLIKKVKEKRAKQARETRVEKKMKEVQKTASRLKEKAGEALAMLSSDSEAIKSFTGCDDDIHRLTELLDCNIKSIKCKISTADTVEIDINTDCRISAGVILKNLSNYVKAPTLRKVFGELIRVEQDEPFTSGNHNKQCGDRILQTELLSLVAAIRANNNLNLAGILLSQTPPDTLEDFVMRLKKMVEDNMYATPACLAIQKLTCELVIEFIKHDRNVEMIDRHNIIATLLEASEVMDCVESNMLFAGVDRDCYGVPLKPLSSVLAKNAEDLLAQRKQALGITINIVPASAPIP